MLGAVGRAALRGTAGAQQPGKGPGAAPANGGSEIVTKVYPVADLVFTAPNYPFQGFVVPGTSDRPSKFGSSEGAAAGGGAGAGGGFGGGGGGGLGGGGFNVLPESKQPAGPSRGGAFSVGDSDGMPMLVGSSSERLAQAIQVSIHPELWVSHGGPGTIVALGDRLIITQTKEVHTAIRDLLDALRQRRRSQYGNDPRLVAAARWQPVSRVIGRYARGFAAGGKPQATRTAGGRYAPTTPKSPASTIKRYTSFPAGSAMRLQG